jgi:AhpD family alkylhydroperoxidase
MRFDPYQAAPGWYQDVLAWSRDLRHSTLSPEIRHLVEIRVSQINDCAFCLTYHTDLALAGGVAQAKLDALAGWRNSSGFSDAERAALSLAEAMTRIGDGNRVDELTWQAARDYFEDGALAALLHVIALINVWNRINVAVEFPEHHPLPT